MTPPVATSAVGTGSTRGSGSVAVSTATVALKDEIVEKTRERSFGVNRGVRGPLGRDGHVVVSLEGKIKEINSRVLGGVDVVKGAVVASGAEVGDTKLTVVPAYRNGIYENSKSKSNHEG